MLKATLTLTVDITHNHIFDLQINLYSAGLLTNNIPVYIVIQVTGRQVGIVIL